MVVGSFDTKIEILRKCGGAALLTGAAFLFTLQLGPYIEPNFFSLFVAAVAFSAWRWGAGYGLLANLLSAVVVLYRFIPPHDSFAIPDANALGRMLLFTANNLFLIWILREVHSAQRRTEEDRIRTHRLVERLIEKMGKGQPVTQQDLDREK